MFDSLERGQNVAEQGEECVAKRGNILQIAFAHAAYRKGLKKSESEGKLSRNMPNHWLDLFV